MDAENKTGPVEKKLRILIKNSELKIDEQQINTAKKIDQIINNENKKKWKIQKIFQKNNNKKCGIYIWGDVGTGKTMIMDMTYQTIQKQKKQRTHFHNFMIDTHKKIHKWRKQNNQKEKDPIHAIANEIAKETKLLCLDEFAVVDVADAMILSQLFTNLFEKNTMIITTSNVKPDNLYKNGLNRQWFLPFIDIVKTKMEVIHINTPTDHRMEKLKKTELYIHGKNAKQKFNKIWKEMTQGLEIHQSTIQHSGRCITFPTTCGGIVKSDFKTLCQNTAGQTPMGNADYIAMTERFHTLFIDNLPKIQNQDKNSVKRFINLIDTWYDQQKMTIINAEKPINEIYNNTKNTEKFEFKRTISRITEMQSHSYLDNFAEKYKNDKIKQNNGDKNETK